MVIFRPPHDHLHCLVPNHCLPRPWPGNKKFFQPKNNKKMVLMLMFVISTRDILFIDYEILLKKWDIN